MIVLSLFDGMSCGQIALNQLGIKVDEYYASEIDKWAIQVTQKNYPDTIQLGDITKWREWDIDWASINLVYGGSPCQGFSFAGKQLAFDDTRSKLFFEFVDIVNHIKSLNPDVKFLLENVRMKKEYLDVISEYMGVQPVMINSALVSAQNRVRFYWTNIGEIEQPEDKGILLKDIIENGEVDREKSLHQMVIVDSLYNNRPPRVYKEKSPTIRSGRSGLIVTGGAIRGRYNEYGIVEPTLTWRKLTPLECERLQTVPDGYTDNVSNTQRYRMLGNGWTVEVIKHIFSKLEAEL